MAYTFVKDFKAGMDRRRPISALEAGTLYTLENAHLTRNGDIESRKKFVTKYELPEGKTFGLHGLLGNLYTFGSVATSVPSGVTYQRLQSVSGSPMSALLDSDNFDGKIYAIAEFADGTVHHFYDGTIVSDWESGVVIASFGDNDGIAAHLRSLIALDEDFTSSVAANTITIEKAENGSFTIDAKTANVEGGTDDQTITLARLRVGLEEVLSVGGITILGGSLSAGVNKVVSLKVNAVDLLAAPIDWQLSNAVTAQTIADEINNTVTVPDYKAVVNGSSVVIQAAEGSGATPNGFVIELVTAGDVVATQGSFTLTGGTFSAGVNTISSITVGGVEILGSSIDWTTSNEATAGVIASTIRAFAANYLAFASGAKVLIGKKTSTGTNPLDEALIVTVAGDVTIGDDFAPVNTQVGDMAGGIAGAKEKWTATIGGTFEVGDKFNIALDSKNFGYVGNPTIKGRLAMTHKSKVYSAASSLLEFSGVNTATGWNSENDTGAGFVNMSNNDGGSQEIVGMEVYQGSIAAFGRESVIIEFVDPDPALNKAVQTVKNTGLRAAKAVIAFSDSDVVYLSDSGIRSLRARDASNSAAMQDIGTAIDDFVAQVVAAESEEIVDASLAAVEPRDGRLWMVIGSTILVFTRFQASGINAWSYYKPGFVISDIAKVGKKIYCRAEDSVYLYGGDSGDEYGDAGEYDITVQLPFLHGDKPATEKEFVAFDMDCENDWEVELLVNPRNLADVVRPGLFDEISYGLPAAKCPVRTTHVAPKMVCSAGGYARISSICMHFIGADTKAG